MANNKVIPKMSVKDMADTYEQRLQSEVRELAQTHTEAAIGTLVTLMKGRKTPPGVRRQAAMDVLSQGWGRPDSRTDSGGDNGTARGLVVNILKLSTGQVEQFRSGKSDDALDVAEAVDIAKAIEGEWE